MLKFKIDENLPRETTELFAEAGHDAVTVGDQNMSGRPDSDVAGVCKNEARAIVTLDLDFADIRAYRPVEFAGIIVFRLMRLDKPYVLAAVARLMPVFNRENPDGKLWIVDETSIRIRA
jgi:predicted nuclease of predicted toxin-antitoxin system